MDINKVSVMYLFSSSIAFEAVVILSKSCLSEGDILSCEVEKVNSISDANEICKTLAQTQTTYTNV